MANVFNALMDDSRFESLVKAANSRLKKPLNEVELNDQIRRLSKFRRQDDDLPLGIHSDLYLEVEQSLALEKRTIGDEEPRLRPLPDADELKKMIPGIERFYKK
jgi:hypothetical protein